MPVVPGGLNEQVTTPTITGLGALEMMREHEEFEVETDEPGEPPLSFWSETVRGVMVE